MLRALIEMGPFERHAMGARGRQLIATRFATKRNAAELMAVYRWLIEGGSMPASIVRREADDS